MIDSKNFSGLNFSNTSPSIYTQVKTVPNSPFVLLFHSTGCSVGLFLVLPDAVSRPSHPAPDRDPEGRPVCRAPHAGRLHVQGRGECRVLPAAGAAPDGRVAKGMST